MAELEVTGPGSGRRDVSHLGDFSTTPRMLLIAALASLVGAVSAGVAWALLRLIGLITNGIFYGRLGTNLVAPGVGHHSPAVVLLAPVAGGLVIGLMARYGSEKIRGHGMPEAIEAILLGGSKVEPRVAILKPVSSAIAIGTGGPFGAEGPIIMTGGAIGSLFAQFLRLTADDQSETDGSVEFLADDVVTDAQCLRHDQSADADDQAADRRPPHPVHRQTTEAVLGGIHEHGGDDGK